MVTSLSKTDLSFLSELDLQGSISFDENSKSANALDFGNVYHNLPAAVVSPVSVQDICKVIRAAARSSNLTVAARGNGHSINGQAQALNGIVIEMSNFKGIEIFAGGNAKPSYADVGAGELWINLLQATLRMGLAPRSWTDYLYLSIGGALQNAGVGGQTFKYGPLISNVLQLEIVTGNGDVVSCTRTSNSDLFFSSLGGLGQFGIITKARIILEPAPRKVRWIRALYSDLKAFTDDQELLISLPKNKTFDYLEGFVVANTHDPVNGWGQVPQAPDRTVNPSMIPGNAGPVLYCLEVAKSYSSSEDAGALDRKIENILAPLHFIHGLLFCVDVSYFDFLNRVYPTERTLRSLGIWEAPHPWLCIFVPKSRIAQFDIIIFKKNLAKGVGGPMLLYPMHKSKWDSRFSTSIPDEDVFYLVALLRSNFPYPKGPHIETQLRENEEILSLCRASGIQMKQYLPHFTRQSDWEHHFGEKWRHFRAMKNRYDPQAILAPGQAIFTRNKV